MSDEVRNVFLIHSGYDGVYLACSTRELADRIVAAFNAETSDIDKFVLDELDVPEGECAFEVLLNQDGSVYSTRKATVSGVSDVISGGFGYYSMRGHPGGKVFTTSLFAPNKDSAAARAQQRMQEAVEKHGWGGYADGSHLKFQEPT